MVRKSSQKGGGLIIDMMKMAFGGTLGYLGAMMLYGFVCLVSIGLFIWGLFLYMKAKDNICQKWEDKPVRVCVEEETYLHNGKTRTRCVKYENSPTETQKECVQEGNISDADSSDKARYYGGITMMVIFGITTLILLLPWIIQGLGWSLGNAAGDALGEKLF